MAKPIGVKRRPLALALALAALIPIPLTAAAVDVPEVQVAVNAAAPLGRAVDQDLIGTNQAHVSAGSIVSALGPDWARTDTSFEGTYDGSPVYDCATGAWNSAILAHNLAADRAEGGTPEVIVDYSPTCLTTSVPPGTNPAYAPPDKDGWVPWDALVAKMATYAIAQGVRVFEVWNEPDWVFFDGNLPAYLQLYLHTARTLEAAAAAAGVAIEVGGPATVTADPVWIGTLGRFAVANDLPLDFVSWHDYANDPEPGPFYSTPLGEMPPPPPSGVPPYWYDPALTVRQYAIEAEAVRQALEGTPSLHPQLVVDEWNLDAGGDPRMSEPYEAGFVAAVLQTAQSAGIDRMCFYNVLDPEGATPYDSFGMVAQASSGSVSPRPAYWAFYFWHDLAGSQVAADVAGNLAPGRVRATASVPTGAEVPAGRWRGRAREVSVLVSNYAGFDPSGVNGTSDPNLYDHVVALTLSGLAPGVYRLELSTVDAAYGGDEPVVASEALRVPASGRAQLDLSAPGYSAVLVQAVRQEPGGG